MMLLINLIFCLVFFFIFLTSLASSLDANRIAAFSTALRFRAGGGDGGGGEAVALAIQALAYAREKTLIKFILTLVFGVPFVIIILSNDPVCEDKRFAYAALGAIITFWFPTKSNAAP